MTQVPFKYLDWDEPIEEITAQLQMFVKKTGFVTKGTFFNPVDIEEVYEAIPNLRYLFKKRNLTDCYSLAVIRALPVLIAPNFPHTDIMPEPYQKIAINWPVYNCENTYTTFYEKKEGATPEVIKLPNGLPYSRYKFEDVVETHRIKLNEPVALRFDILHAVINDTDIVRVTASFRFRTNHWELFEN